MPRDFSRIELALGDITTVEVAAIVNAATPSLLGGGGVDGAIHAAAGPDLLEECQGLPLVPGRPGERCATGDAKITGGHALPAKHVVHTPGPVYAGGKSGEADLLASCYRRSIEVAAEAGCKTIAFPAISPGIYGYPIGEAARVALEAVADTLATQPGVERVTFVLFDDDALAAFESALKQLN